MRVLRFLALVILVADLPLRMVQAQSQAGESRGTGTISGRVTANGKPIAGVLIILRAIQKGGPISGRTSILVKTDIDGRYEFSGIAAGSYLILPQTPVYAPAGETSTGFPVKDIALKEGEKVTDVDIILVRGAAITGKITDSAGRPVVEQHAQLMQLDARNRPIMIFRFARSQLASDDRGIYRFYGVPPGRYLVSAGGDGGKYPPTFHPGVTDRKQAPVIEVTESGEVTGIDIRFDILPKTYAISGRAVDAETGNPVSNVTILHATKQPNGRSTGESDNYPVNSNGEFRLDGVKPGKYGLSAKRRPGGQALSDGYSEEMLVDVVDEDLTGIEIRVKRGGIISGVAVIEGMSDQSALSRLARERILAQMRDYGDGVAMNIDQNGRYRAEGLRPGKWALSHMPGRAGEGSFTLLRVERDGVILPDTFEIGPGEQVTGLRCIFGQGTGVVRGRVVVTGETLPEGTAIYVEPHRIGSPRQDMSTGIGKTDARGFFVLEGLAPGQYELEAEIHFQFSRPPEWQRVLPTAKAMITISNGQTLEVTLTINLKQ